MFGREKKKSSALTVAPAKVYSNGKQVLEFELGIRILGLDQIVEYGKTVGAKKILIMTNPENAVDIKFYDRNDSRGSEADLVDQMIYTYGMGEKIHIRYGKEREKFILEEEGANGQGRAIEFKSVIKQQIIQPEAPESHGFTRLDSEIVPTRRALQDRTMEGPSNQRIKRVVKQA